MFDSLVVLSADLCTSLSLPAEFHGCENTYAEAAQMNLTALDIFVDVMRKGSLSAVARDRDTTPSSISRAIAALEAPHF